MALQAWLAALLLAALALSPNAAACTVEPEPVVLLDTEPASIVYVPPCPPNPGRLDVRVLEHEISLPVPA